MKLNLEEIFCTIEGEYENLEICNYLGLKSLKLN